MDWTGQELPSELPTTPGPSWAAALPNFVAKAGATVGSYDTMLAGDATYEGQLGNPSYDVAALVNLEIQNPNVTPLYQSAQSSESGTGGSSGVLGVADLGSQTFENNLNAPLQGLDSTFPSRDG